MNIEFDIEYKKLLISTLQSLISCLESNGLQYYVCGGTALGTVRHNGIIPWDDDIDIFMPRKDYEELKRCFISYKIKGYDLYSIDNSECFITYMKYVNNSTTFWELESIKFLSGVFIDIFPIDYFNGTIEDFKKKYSDIKKLRQIGLLSCTHFSVKSLIKSIREKNAKRTKMILLGALIPGFIGVVIKKRIKKYDNEFKQIVDGSNMVCFYGSYGIKEFYNKDWFKASILHKFESFNVRLPIGYDEYLSQLYGNYMQLPPVEKRVYEHNHYYVNLKERVSLSEAKKRIEGGFTEEY